MIDLLELKHAIENLKPHQNIFRVLKAELTLQGYWKNRHRGKAFSKGYDSRRNITEALIKHHHD